MDNSFASSMPPVETAAPAPGAAPVMETVPPVPMPQPGGAAPASFGAGGATPAPKNGLNKFFEGITVADIGIIALITASTLMLIYYTRKKIDQLKKDVPEVKKKVEEIEVNVKTALGQAYKSL